jgi:TetR/AcrR family transcriptional regulator, transcriptional repressor for nem operon
MDTRGRIVAAARDLFAEKGYQRATLQDAAKKAGVLAGSIYHFFAKKSALLQAVLQSYRDGLYSVVMNPAFSRTADPVERIFEVLADYRERVVKSNFRYRCPIGALALEISNDDDAARALVAANFLDWRDAIETCLKQAARKSRRRFDTAAVAAFVLTVMEGGVMQSLAMRSIEPYDSSVRQLRNYVNLLLKGK